MNATGKVIIFVYSNDCDPQWNTQKNLNHFESSYKIKPIYDRLSTFCLCLMWYFSKVLSKCEETKGQIEIHKSNKNRHHLDQNKKTTKRQPTITKYYKDNAIGQQ